LAAANLGTLQLLTTVLGVVGPGCRVTNQTMEAMIGWYDALEALPFAEGFALL
jgi:hypothetical protein